MKILMVCLGNICRSPMAEAILKSLAEKEGLSWVVDSAGTESFRVGENAHSGTIKVCKMNGIDSSAHIARRFRKSDFETYDIIYALATDVYREIKHFSTDSVQMQKVKLIMDEINPGANLSVKDPYYGTEKDFHDIFETLTELSETIIRKYR
ncbi:MAG: low molecular weight phosphotyrosine protein phosphatase [Bacteroidia bacterium]|nr:low molecular weight phosphotyrosine protein phosphatase [Bacteroidia bacterium]